MLSKIGLEGQNQNAFYYWYVMLESMFDALLSFFPQNRSLMSNRLSFGPWNRLPTQNLFSWLKVFERFLSPNFKKPNRFLSLSVLSTQQNFLSSESSFKIQICFQTLYRSYYSKSIFRSWIDVWFQDCGPWINLRKENIFLFSEISFDLRINSWPNNRFLRAI